MTQIVLPLLLLMMWSSFNYSTVVVSAFVVSPSLSLSWFSMNKKHTNNNIPAISKAIQSLLFSMTSSSSSKAEEGSLTTTMEAFPRSNPPYLALITERSSCDTDENVDIALKALYSATVLAAAEGDTSVDLVSVRVNVPFNDVDEIRRRSERLTRIIQTLVMWSNISKKPFRVVVSSDWIETGMRAGAHGVHFKEIHRDKIPYARKLYQQFNDDSNSSKDNMLVGTSTHTVESALDAVDKYQPDYFFAGTCFETESHPEKTGDDLEGPAFPAEVVRALVLRAKTLNKRSEERPKVLSIGGLDASNCHQQTKCGHYIDGYNADGIATIRAVLRAKDPAKAVWEIKHNMMVVT